MTTETPFTRTDETDPFHLNDLEPARVDICNEAFVTIRNKNWRGHDDDYIIAGIHNTWEIQHARTVDEIVKWLEPVQNDANGWPIGYGPNK